MIVFLRRTSVRFFSNTPSKICLPLYKKEGRSDNDNKGKKCR